MMTRPDNLIAQPRTPVAMVRSATMAIARATLAITRATLAMLMLLMTAGSVWAQATAPALGVQEPAPQAVPPQAAPASPAPAHEETGGLNRGLEYARQGCGAGRFR